MKTRIISDIKKAYKIILENKVISLPAEGCFGLSALPTQLAVDNILTLKGRSKAKGLILVGHSLDVFLPWIDLTHLTNDQKDRLNQLKSRPTTWVVPVKKFAKCDISGQHDSIAIRITEHPVLAQLSKMLNSAIISTSANLQGQPPAKTVDGVLDYFDGKIAAVFEGQINDDAKPSQIIDLISGNILRN